MARLSMLDQDMLTLATLEKVPMEWSGKANLTALFLAFPLRAKNSCMNQIYLRRKFRT